jgi:hypothetical protein
MGLEADMHGMLLIALAIGKGFNSTPLVLSFKAYDLYI